uniref:Integrin, alpha 2b n=1 Tax=Echeneis naucrates TaxID=173247 RepID=A0A665WIK0_ECHNA
QTGEMAAVMCVFECVWVLLSVSMCVCLNLMDEAVMFSGPTGSLFGFAADFFTISNKSFVVIGAPKANSTQSGVMGGGGVFLCPLSDGDQSCDIINFDLKGKFLTFNQAKVHSDTWTVLSSQACAPLFHWNVQRDGAESGATPVGNCFLLDHRTGNSSIFSPCRGTMVEDDYKQIKNSKIKSWSEGGFRFRTGQLVVGAPGSFYFQGKWRPLVAVTDINRDGLDDVVIGAPLFMDRVMEQLQERGQVVVYLQKKHTSFKSQPDQSLIGFSLYGRFGSALAVLGDLDMDGYHDVAVGAPWSGDTGQGQVFIYLGNSNGLSSTPSQVIDSPLSNGLTAFGFTLRGGSDVDDNGYPDLLVGAWAADRAFVYRSQAVIRCRVSLSLFPDFLNPDVKQCLKGETSVFNIKICVYVSGHRIPQETALWVDLQLDKMKQTMARRTSLLSTNQPQKIMMLVVHREVGVACMNLTAYLRSEDEFRDKLSPIFTTLNISLNTIQNALLYGQTHAAAQSRIILDCGDDNICVPDLNVSDCVFVGEEQSVLISVLAENAGEGAFETELEVEVPEETHFQSSQGVNKLVCVQRKKNESVIVTCDLGNPMTHRQTLQTDLLFSVGHLEEVESHITFSLRIRRYKMSLHLSVQLMQRWSSEGKMVGGVRPTMHPGSLEELGPVVEHVYELRNQGPSTINARLTVDFPSSWNDHFLLYVSSNASEESTRCWTLNASQIDPFKVQNLSLSLSLSLSLTLSLFLCLSDPSDTGCVRFVCDVTMLGRGFSAVVRISARLWTHIVIQTPYLNYELVSSASYDVINTSSKVQPMLLPHGHTQTQVSVLWRPPDGETDVPVGYIILSIISGLLLLGLLCFIFWKVTINQFNQLIDLESGSSSISYLTSSSLTLLINVCLCVCVGIAGFLPAKSPPH